MQSVNRRTALLGTAAALGSVSVVATTSEAAPADPHPAWLAELAANYREIVATCEEMSAHEATLERDLGGLLPELTVRLPAASQTFHTRPEILACRDKQIGALEGVLYHLNNVPGLDRDGMKRDAMAFWNKALEDFDAIKARFDAHPSTAAFAECEDRHCELWDRERDIMFQIADTPAQTMEGVRVQLMVLEQWMREGTVQRADAAEDPPKVGTVSDPIDKEVFALTVRIMESVATITGNDPRIRYGGLNIADIEAGRVVPLIEAV